jgi:hypothetical protein
MLPHWVDRGTMVGALWAAAYEGRLDVVEFVSSYLTAEQAHENQSLAVRWAVQEGHVDVAAWLVERFGPGDTSVDRWAALRRACRAGHLQTAKWCVATYPMSTVSLDLSEARAWATPRVAAWLATLELDHP